MTTVRDVVIDHNFPEYIEIICERLAGDWTYWEDYADCEALHWTYHNDTLEIEID